VPSTAARSTQREIVVGSFAFSHWALVWKTHSDGPSGVLRQIWRLPAMSCVSSWAMADGDVRRTSVTADAAIGIRMMTPHRNGCATWNRRSGGLFPAVHVRDCGHLIDFAHHGTDRMSQRAVY
jgi:hypothetical protein